MKLKVLTRSIIAYRTREPERIARLMKEAESVNLPESLYHAAADIGRTVHSNMRNAEQAAETAAAYVLRYAYLLSQSGQLVEAPPKPKKVKEGGEV